MDFRQRTDGIQVRHPGFQAWHAVRRSADFQFVRPHVNSRRVALLLIWAIQAHFADVRLSAVNPAVKDVYIAEKIYHKGAGGMIEYLRRRADLFDGAVV